MNLFVVAVVTEPSRADAVQRSILDAHALTTPFADVPHQVEVWQRGHVVAASFSIHADRLSIGNYCRGTDRTFDTFAGLPRVDAAPGQDWATALAEARERGRLDIGELGGVWALAHADADEVEVRTSSTGSIPLVLARRPGLVLLSNRAALARVAAWPEFPIAYDTDALSTMCSRGWLAHDRVPFSGLELLQPGVHVRATPDRVDIAPGKLLAGPGDAPPDDAEVDDVYDTMAEELVAAARHVGRLGPRPRLELTGDVVTRLSAAVYAAAGVDVLAVTPHAPDDPHSVVAGEVAALVGFDHVSEPVAFTADGIVDAATRQVLQGEGLSNVYDLCPPVRLDPDVEVVRHAGGSLLAGYDNLRSGPRPAVTSIDEARTFLDDLALHNHMLLLREEARTAQQQVNRRTAEELLDEVGRLSYYELAYLRLREGRGTGANRQAAAYGSVQPAPMLDDRVLRHVPSIPLAHKRSQRSVYELIRRLRPELAEHRFVGARWRFEQDGPALGLPADRWEARAPLPAAPEHLATRATPQGRLWPSVAERLGEPDRLLDEIVDRVALRATLRREEPLTPADVRTLFGALTARQLVSGAWLPKTRGRNGSRGPGVAKGDRGGRRRGRSA